MPRCGRRCGGTARRSWPSKRIEPDIAGTVPESVLNSVVLPAPFGPTIETNSPAPTSIETSCSTGTDE
jgi:hypothetical protein